MIFPFIFHGEIKIPAAEQLSAQAALEKLATAIKMEGGTDVAIEGDHLEFSGVTGQLSFSPLVNLDRSDITISYESNFLCLRYVARPERWGAYVAVIAMAVGVVAWLFSIFPLRFPAGFGLALLVIWGMYVLIVRLRYQAFLRRSIGHT
jgi:hypothetical protein